jgi:hypothetical protein
MMEDLPRLFLGGQRIRCRLIWELSSRPCWVLLSDSSQVHKPSRFGGVTRVVPGLFAGKCVV